MRLTQSEPLEHGAARVHAFSEDQYFNIPVQVGCVFVGGSLAYRISKVYNINDPTEDMEGQMMSIRYYSRVGTQKEQADAIITVVIPNLISHNITQVPIIFAPEEAVLPSLEWTETFPMLMDTLERVLVINERQKCKFRLIAAPMVFPYGEGGKPLHARVAAHNSAVWAFNYHVQKAYTPPIWRFTTNKTCKVDTVLRVDVQGMSHIILSKANYEHDSKRAPSENCLLRIRKMIRKAVSINFLVDTDGEQAPYRIRSATSRTALPPPTAVDRHGKVIALEQAVQQRVQAILEDRPQGEMPMQPAIDEDAYTFVSDMAAQEKVDRRRGALGLERSTAATTPRAGPSKNARSVSSSNRSRSAARTGDLREQIKRPLPPSTPRGERSKGGRNESSSTSRRSRTPKGRCSRGSS